MRFPAPVRGGAVLALCWALFACGGTATAPAEQQTADPSTVTIQTNNGEMVVTVTPQRVVALDSTSFETLIAMDVIPVAAPKQLLPDSAAAWREDTEITDIGTHREPRLEEINAAQPDLIIGGKRFAEYTDQLSAIAPVIDIAPDVEADDYVDALKQQTTTLGEIFDQTDTATRLNQELDAAVATAAAGTHGQTVFLANHNGGKIDNGAGRLAALIQPLDLTDVFAGQSGGSDSVHQDSGLAPETVAQANPDWMIVLDRDAVAAENATPARATVEAQEAWTATTFIARNQVFYLERDFYLTEGIQAYTNFYQQFAEALNNT